jgi:signal transduction histidine kinase
MRIERWLTIAGFTTWLVSALPSLLRIINGNMSPGGVMVWAVAFPLFGIAFGAMCFDRPGLLRRRSVRLVLLALQSVAGLAMTGTAPDIFPAATLVVVAGQLDEMPQSVAAAWIVAQTIALAVISLMIVNPVLALAIAGSFGGFQTFAYVTASLARRERLGRQELSRAHEELLSTRALLAESSRNEERLRISRDLHDTLGHHLTALSLQLDVASRLTDGKAAEHVQQAYAITRLLLSDVRNVVSELRSGTRSDLGREIRRLAASSSDLSIDLELHEIVEIGDARADAVLHCVQEVITNTRRHAGARNLWMLVSLASQVTILARDDGRGAKAIAPGNGLTGMRERFETLGGRIEFRNGEGRGFVVEGFLPERDTT